MDFRLPSINKIFIVGNLLADPELTVVTEKKISVVNFKIASNKKFKNNEGQKKDKVCFVNIVAWSKLAVICADNLRRGDGVYIEGELQTRSVVNSGERITITEVLANRIQFLTKHFQNEDTFSSEENETITPE